MNSKDACTLGLGVCVSLLALSAAGQTATGNPPAAAPQGAAATASAPASDSAGKAKAAHPSTHKHHASAHHASAHHAKHTKHEHVTAAGGHQETAYQTALKSCVAGPAGQRDRCLDDAIARYARS